MSTTLVDEEFRRRLRLIMQQFGSVADLARAVGVSDNAIYKWVSGRGQPSMMSLVNLSKEFNVEHTAAHTALSDAHATANVYIQMLKRLKDLVNAVTADDKKSIHHHTNV